MQRNEVWHTSSKIFKYCEMVHQHKHVKIQNKEETVKRIGIVPFWLLNQCSKMVLNARHGKLLYTAIDSNYHHGYYVCVSTHSLG